MCRVCIAMCSCAVVAAKQLVSLLGRLCASASARDCCNTAVAEPVEGPATTDCGRSTQNRNTRAR